MDCGVRGGGRSVQIEQDGRGSGLRFAWNPRN